MLQFNILDYFNVALSKRELSALNLFSQYTTRARKLQFSKCDIDWVDNWIPAYEEGPEPAKVSGHFCSNHFELLDDAGICPGAYKEVKDRVKETARETLDAAILTRTRIYEKLEGLGLAHELQNLDLSSVRNGSE